MSDSTAGYAQLLERLRQSKPLVHHITNYVTVNDCANVTLGIGASPIMADALEESEAIAAISSALVLNMGTLNARTIASMLAAGAAANAAKVPVVFDPVGAGASELRNETAARLLKDLRFSVVRGNISEIRFLAGASSKTKGVDAAESDLTAIGDAQALARNLAVQLKTVIAITGAVDIVSDGSRTASIANGHPMLANLTGTGCMCSSLIGSYIGTNPELPFESALAALLSMGIAGEIAFAAAGELGNGSFRVALHDAISRLDGQSLSKRAKVEIV